MLDSIQSKSNKVEHVQTEKNDALDASKIFDKCLNSKGGCNITDVPAATQIFKPKPENACVADADGYIVCGPIVGYERPAQPTLKDQIFVK